MFGERRRARVDALVAVAVFALAAAYFSLSATRSFELSDEGHILYHSARVADGDLPYRDFPDAYGPGVFLVTGALLRAFDGHVLGVRAALVALKALAVALAYLLTRFVVPRPIALLGAAIATAFWGRLSWNLNTPYAALYTIPLLLVACFALVCALRTDSRRAYFVAGLVGGAAVLFKQTLGILYGGAMGLAVLAVAALAAPPAARTRGATVRFLGVWVLGAVAMVVPVWRLLRPRDYVLHFLPLHAFMLVVAIAAVRRGCGPMGPAVPHRVVPLVAGLAVLPGLVVGVYAWAGQLDALMFNLFTLPSTIVNYYIGVPYPPLGRCLLLAGAVGLVSAGLLALGGRRGAAWRVALLAVLVVCVAAAVHGHDRLSTIVGPKFRHASDSWWWVILWTVPAMVEGALPALVILAATVAFTPGLVSGRRELSVATLQVFLPVVLLEAVLSYQVFPRGSFNVWLVHGALAPLAALVAWRWHGLVASATASTARRAAGVALVGLVPLWMVAPVVHHLFFNLSLPGATPVRVPEMRGVVLSLPDRRIGRAGEMEELVEYLRAAEPRDAPLLPISIDMMMLYLSGRRHAFPELDYYFYLLGLDMLPPAQRAALADGSLVERLAQMPAALVVIRKDKVSTRMLNALGELRDALSRDYETIAERGSYHVLRRRDGAVVAGRPVAQ